MLNRTIHILVATLLGVTVTVSTAQSIRANPIVIDLAVTAARGLVFGGAQKAGEEIYSNLRGNQNSPTPSSQPSSSSATSTTSIPPSSTSSGVQTVPVVPPTQPDRLVWRVRNHHGNAIVLQFYAPERKAVWPPNRQAFLLSNADPISIPLRCMPGERVCFGAWSRGKFWGGGYQMSRPCRECCRRCGSDGRGVTLL